MFLLGPVMELGGVGTHDYLVLLPFACQGSEFRLSAQVISPRSLADLDLGWFGLILLILIQAFRPTVLSLGHS